MNSPSDLALEYRGMTDDQLLQLASEGGFTDEAKLALQTEMSRRKLTQDMVESLRDEQSHYENAKKWRDPNVKTFIWGVGLDVFGRAYLSQEDKQHDIRVRTKWFVLRNVPIFPIASYRYEYKERTIGQIKWQQEKLLNRVTLNWKQVLTTYAQLLGFVILILGAVWAYSTWDLNHPHKP